MEALKLDPNNDYDNNRLKESQAQRRLGKIKKPRAMAGPGYHICYFL